MTVGCQTYNLHTLGSTHLDWGNCLLFPTWSDHEKTSRPHFFVTFASIASEYHQTCWFAIIFSNYRNESVQELFNQYCQLVNTSEIYPTSSRAEENYVRHFLNGKHIRVSTLGVSLYSYLNTRKEIIKLNILLSEILKHFLNI